MPPLVSARKFLMALMVAAAVVPAPAQLAGIWQPLSNTASSITGDLTLSGSKLMIGRYSYTIATIRQVTQDEGNAAFDGAGRGVGTLYRLSIPATQRFEHKNTLCGSSETQWMLAYVSFAGKKPTLNVAFFSGSKAPELKPDAISNSTDLCGTFSYVH